MNELDLSTLEHKLKSTEVGIAKLLARREGIAVETSPDSSDEAQYQLCRELNAHSLHHETRLLSAVRFALQRIADDTYGICERCDGDISPKRLAAIPWASYCIRCQETIDQEEQGGVPEKAHASFSLTF